MKELVLVRGISGSGKSTFAKSIGGVHFEADQYFMVDGEYKFDPTKLSTAHKWCQVRVEHAMEDEKDKIVVSNTFTQEWEMQPYFDLAEKYGYRTHSIIVENRHNGVNEHGVPEEKLQQMSDRFQTKLK